MSLLHDYASHLDRQIGEGLAIGRSFCVPPGFKKIRKILFFGMGGSAAGGHILRTCLLESSPVPFVILPSSSLPSWIDRETLIIFSSYSGNTVEVLDAFSHSLRLKVPSLIVTSGGKLREAAQKYKLPILLLPPHLPPRCAIGYLTFSMIPLFRKMNWIRLPEAAIRETIACVRRVTWAEASSIAKKIFRQLPHIYTFSGALEAAAIRWRTQLAENAKALCSHHLLPEMFHNEIEAWNQPPDLVKRSTALFFMDREDPRFIQRKRKFAQKVIRSRGGKIIEVKSQGRSRLARLFYMICLGDKVSLKLAELNKVDPSLVPALDAIKKIK